MFATKWLTVYCCSTTPLSWSLLHYSLRFLWFSGALLSVSCPLQYCINALRNRHEISLENREIVLFSSTFLFSLFISSSFWSFVTFLLGRLFLSLLALLPLPACLICCFSSNTHETRLVKYIIPLREFRSLRLSCHVLRSSPFRVLFSIMSFSLSCFFSSV